MDFVVYSHSELLPSALPDYATATTYQKYV